MRMRTWIIIVAVIIIAAVASMAFLMPQQSNVTVNPVNQTVQSATEPNIVNITVKTDGKSTTINAAKVSGSGNVAEAMITEMKRKASADVLSDKSTASSLKSDMTSIAQKYNFTATVTINSQFGTDNLPFAATVSGTSMLPTLKDGQNVIALKTTSFKVGDIVIARHPTYGLIIKRVAAISNGKVHLVSDNKNVQTITNETTLSDGVVEIQTYEKTSLNAWLSKSSVIAVVKNY